MEQILEMKGWLAISMMGNLDYIGDHENSNKLVEIAKYRREKMKYWIFIVKMK